MQPGPFDRQWDTARPRRLEQTLRTYRLSDGALLSSVDLGYIEGDVEGLAFDGEGVLAVAGRELLTLDGAGNVIARYELDDLDAAVGLTREGGRIWVADGVPDREVLTEAELANRVLVYDLPPSR